MKSVVKNIDDLRINKLFLTFLENAINNKLTKIVMNYDNFHNPLKIYKFINTRKVIITNHFKSLRLLSGECVVLHVLVVFLRQIYKLFVPHRRGEF